jgi:hypothetical protein
VAGPTPDEVGGGGPNDAVGPFAQREGSQGSTPGARLSDVLGDELGGGRASRGAKINPKLWLLSERPRPLGRRPASLLECVLLAGACAFGGRSIIPVEPMFGGHVRISGVWRAVPCSDGMDYRHVAV